MVKQIVVLPFNEISGISGKKIQRNELWIHSTWIDTHNIKLHQKKKKPVSKGYLLHDSIFITFSIWQNYRDGEEINGCQGLGKERGCNYTEEAWVLWVMEQFYILTMVVIVIYIYIWLNVIDMSHVWIVHKNIQKNVKTAEIWVTLVKCCV